MNGVLGMTELALDTELSSRAARVPGDRLGVGRLAAHDHQRHPRLLQDRGRHARRSIRRRSGSASASRSTLQHAGAPGAQEGSRAGLPHRPGRAGRCSSATRAAPADPGQPGRQRDQVHRRGRSGGRRSRDEPRRRGRARAPLRGAATPASAFRRTSTSTSSTPSPRPTAPPRGSYGGTGLGLAISAQLVADDGRADLRWRARRARAAPSASPPASASRAPSPSRRARLRSSWTGCRVLVVDDNATNRRILARDAGQLADVGRRPPTAAVPRSSCWRPPRARASAFPLVLLDANMPEMDGFALAERIRDDAGTRRRDRHDADLGRAIRSDLARCRELGVGAYVTKPLRQSGAARRGDDGARPRRDRARRAGPRRRPQPEGPRRSASCWPRTTR